MGNSPIIVAKVTSTEIGHPCRRPVIIRSNEGRLILRLDPPQDGGFTLVELLIAMLLLLIIGVSVGAILTQSLVQSVKDSELVTATSLANQAIEQELALKTCSGLTALTKSTTIRPNVVLSTVRTVGACPIIFPGTVTVNVVVTNLATSAVDASVRTLVFVTGP